MAFKKEEKPGEVLADKGGKGILTSVLKIHRSEEIRKASSEELLGKLLDADTKFTAKISILAEIQERVMDGDLFFTKKKAIEDIFGGCINETNSMVAEAYGDVIAEIAERPGGGITITNLLRKESPELYAFIKNKRKKDIKNGTALHVLNNQEIAGVLYMYKAFGEDGKKVMELIDKYNITYGIRYSPEFLNKMYDGIKGKQDETMPLCIVVMTKDDWNGAFYNDRAIYDQLSETHRVAVVEVETDTDFYKKINEIRDMHGKASLMIIGGHGNPEGIRLGRGGTEREYIDETDIKQEESEMTGVGSAISKGGTVILASCSTGKGRQPIAALLSKATGRRVVAPKKDSSISAINAHFSAAGAYIYEVNYLAGSGLDKFEGSVFVWGINLDWVSGLLKKDWKLSGLIPKKEKK